MQDEYHGKNRRKPLTPEELAEIKDQIFESLAADVGKKGVRGIIWLIGAVIVAFLAWVGLKVKFVIGQ